MGTFLCIGAIPNNLKSLSFNSRLPQRHRRILFASTRSSLTDQSRALLAKNHLLSIISDQDRGLKTRSDPQKLEKSSKPLMPWPMSDATPFLQAPPSLTLGGCCGPPRKNCF
ncbi:hypothetical protein M9H77_33418 [Catharanthus roseus]|uniref:Uncharacterized protein n=1 Tax=Catharanthus roseus TaxID=4058 RepID=A0ACB9ZJ40_CATRO|nr:hypothetical protein M9H77_33418 [Catharanthus roseus]